MRFGRGGADSDRKNSYRRQVLKKDPSRAGGRGRGGGYAYRMETSPDDPKPGSVTQLLNELHSAGGAENDSAMLKTLIDEIQTEFNALARKLRPEQSTSNALRPSDLVQTAYRNLLGTDNWNFQSRRTFYKYATETMKNVLREHARDQNAIKRKGLGPGKQVDYETWVDSYADNTPEAGSLFEAPEYVEMVERALEALAIGDSDSAEVLNLAFYEGFSNAQIADILGLKVDKVKQLRRVGLAAVKEWIKENKEH